MINSQAPFMKRKFVILLGLAALGIAAGLGCLRGLHERRLVASWTTDDVKHWDFNRSWRANQENRRAGLRSVAPLATKILRKNLNYESLLSRSRHKLPTWLGRWLDEWSSNESRSPQMVRANAAHHLGVLGRGARDALPDLIRRSSDVAFDEFILIEVALAIGSIGENTSEARAALGKLMTNRYPQLNACAAFSLWRLDPSDTTAQRQLEPLINEGTLVSLAGPLSDMGEVAKPLAAAVRRTFPQVKNMNTKLNVAYALWRMTGDAEAPLALVKSLCDEYEQPSHQPFDRAARGRNSSYISSAALVFEDIPECRVALRPLLSKLGSRGEQSLTEFKKIEKEQKGLK
jgi:hypothetical protein